MFILYIDGSGSVKNPDDAHFVLAGVAVFERQIFHLIKGLDELVDSFGLGPSDQIELHGSPMFSGRRGPWGAIPRPRRITMMNEALNVLTSASKGARALKVN